MNSDRNSMEYFERLGQDPNHDPEKAVQSLIDFIEGSLTDSIHEIRELQDEEMRLIEGAISDIAKWGSDVHRALSTSPELQSELQALTERYQALTSVDVTTLSFDEQAENLQESVKLGLDLRKWELKASMLVSTRTSLLG